MKELIILLFIILIIYIVITKIPFFNNYEGLCIDTTKCGETELENVLKYDWKTEPNNPFYSMNMVIPQLSDKYSGENIKNRYLTNANIVYSDIENDILNSSLLPKPNTPFIYP